MPNIPEKFRSKIRIEDECWIWTGYVVPGRKNAARLNIPSPTAQESPLRNLMQVYDTAPSPRATYKGVSRPANRVVMAEHLGLDYEQVPKLKRACHHQLCVNPDHHVLGVKPPTKHHSKLFETEAVAETTNLLDALKLAEPLPELGAGNAAEELGVPHIPSEIWDQYLAHCMEAQET